MKHKLLRDVSLLALVTGLSLQGASAQDYSDSTLLERLTITATKRNQDYFALPATIDIAQPDALERRNIDNVADLDRVFPDVNIRTRSGRTYANFTIRGQASLDFYNPSTQVYIDGLPQDSFNLARALPGNLDSVELLYGPQARYTAAVPLAASSTSRPVNPTMNSASGWMARSPQKAPGARFTSTFLSSMGHCSRTRPSPPCAIRTATRR